MSAELRSYGPIFGRSKLPGLGIAEQFLGEKPGRNGFFVELGGGNGHIQSNTFHLERDHGWSGILIEGNRWLFAQLIRNRPNCQNVEAVVSDVEGEEVLFNEIRYDADDPSSAFMGHSAIVDDRRRYTDVRQTRTLASILRQEDCPLSIDLLVIDVEDGFLKVLRGMDFEHFDVKTVIVEMQLNRDLITATQLLFDFGYRMVKCYSAGPDFVFQK